MRRGIVVGVLAVTAALVALLAYGVVSQGTDRSIDDALHDGRRVAAPQTDLPVLGGAGERSVADYRGRVVVLNFWASWCPPCVDELPLLERAQRGLLAGDGTVLGVNYKDIPEDAVDLVRRSGLTYPSVRDRDGAYAERFATVGFPETFVIDRRGRIAAARRGPVTRQWLEETLRPVLAEGA